MISRSGELDRNGLALLGITLLGVALLFMSCTNGKPFEPARVGEIPDRPGLFTGDKGAFVLTRDISADSVQSGTDSAQQVEPTAPSAAPSKSRNTSEDPGDPGRKTPPPL